MSQIGALFSWTSGRKGTNHHHMARENRTAKQVGDLRLAPIRAWAQANRGSVQRITTWLQDNTGEAITRQTVGRWLTADPEKRQQPQFGWGLMLEEAYAALA